MITPLVSAARMNATAVGAVLVIVHEDALALLHRQRPERRVPRRRRVLEPGDLARARPDQTGDRVVHGVIEIGRGGRRFVATFECLTSEVVHLRRRAPSPAEASSRRG